MRFRRFARRRLRRLGLLAVGIAVTLPMGAFAHDEPDDEQHRRTADLALALTAAPSPVQGGDTVTFALTITNLGPNTARRVRTAIALTGAREIVQAPSLGWSCTIVGAVADCRRHRLRSHTSSQITFTATAPRGFGRIGAGAVVTSRTDDPARANNTTSLEIDVNNPPVVNADTATTTTGIAVPIPVMINDSDPDGDQLTFAGTTGPSSDLGSVTCEIDECTYTPGTGFVGNDTFSYTVRDGRGAAATGLVTVSVKPAVPPSPPPDPLPPPPPPDNSGNGAPGVTVDGPQTVVPGQVGPFTITVANGCSVVARNVRVRLTLPAGTTLVSAPSRAVLKGRTLTVSIGALRSAKARRVGIRLRFRANGGNLRTLVAAVTSTNGRLAGDGIVIAVRQ